MDEKLHEFVLPLRYTLRNIHIILPIENAAIVKLDNIYTCIPLFDIDKNRKSIYIATENSSLLRLFKKIPAIEQYDIALETHFVGFSVFNESGLVSNVFEKHKANCRIQKPSYGEIYKLVKQKHEDMLESLKRINRYGS